MSAKLGTEEKAASVRESSRKYRQKNQDALREKGRDRYRSNAESWNQKKKEKRAENLDEVRRVDREAAKARYAQMTTEQKSARSKAHYEKHRDAFASRRRLSRYGLTDAAYADMLNKQGGMCLICSASPGNGETGTLAVDHCHSTGLVRGLLCRGCNLGISFLENNPDMIGRVQKYLSSSESRATLACQALTKQGP